MGKRLSDTDAIASTPSGEDGCKTVTVSVSKIDNGYITRTSSYGDGMDDYKSTERYSPTPPKIVEPREATPRSRGTLSAAIRSMK